MANFLTAQKKALKLTPQKISNDLFNFIRTLEVVLADYNVDRLFNSSEDIFGKPIGFYSKGTELITNGRKKEGQPFNLKETGEFLEKLFAKVQKDSIFFDSSDTKKQDVLRNLLTPNIFGLQDEDLNRVIKEKLLPFFLRYFKKNLI